MKRFDVFKVTFLSMSVAIFTMSFIYGLFKLEDSDFLNKGAIIQMMLKSMLAAVFTGAVLGVLNMFFKTVNLKK